MDHCGKTFLFKHEIAALPSMVRACLGYVDAQSDKAIFPPDFHQKVQWAVTELLLNGVKHSGLEESLIRMEFNETGLTVFREDDGLPLTLNVVDEDGALMWPLEETLIDRQFTVYTNGSDALQVYTESSSKVHFQVSDILSEEMPALLENTSEHFGLMIIAKASDRFSYSYTQGKNVFSTTFNY